MDVACPLHHSALAPIKASSLPGEPIGVRKAASRRPPLILRAILSALRGQACLRTGGGLWQEPAACRAFSLDSHLPAACCRSSVVEHSLGKGEVHSSILCGSTMNAHEIGAFRVHVVPQLDINQRGLAHELGENPGNGRIAQPGPNLSATQDNGRRNSPCSVRSLPTDC